MLWYVLIYAVVAIALCGLGEAVYTDANPKGGTYIAGAFFLWLVGCPVLTVVGWLI